MRVAVIGRSDALFHSAKALIENGYEVPLIVTSKAAPEYGFNEESFEKLADEIGARFIYSPVLNDKLADIKEVGEMDIAISANYTGILSQPMIDLVRLGVLNAHGGDLPRYRGNACQAWAILNGEKRVGFCIHKMVGGQLDSGDIIARNYLEISENTKVGAILDWISEIAPSMFLEAISALKENPSYRLASQSTDAKDILRCYPRMPQDGAISWSSDAIDILRLVNASNEPYAGAFCYFNGKKMTVWDAELQSDGENFLAVPGQVTEISDGDVVVAAGQGKIRIKMIEYQSKRGSPGDLITSIRTRLTDGI